MRWPSVYLIGWFVFPLLLGAFVGAWMLASFVVNTVEGILPVSDEGGVLIFMICLTILAVGLHRLVSCPRCGRGVHQRGAFFVNTFWPVARCSRCDLDLRRFHPFDRRAKVDR